MKKNGDFYIANEGKRPIYVDGKAVLTGNKESLRNNSVIEVICVSVLMLFLEALVRRTVYAVDILSIRQLTANELHVLKTDLC
jgi:hypothetical protein